MDHAKTQGYINRIWDSSIVPELTEYIRIPNKSVAFDPEWQAHGYMDKVVARFEKWAREHAPKGATIEVVRLPEAHAAAVHGNPRPAPVEWRLHPALWASG